MKFTKIALFIALAGVMVLSSCKKDDDDAVVLKSFSFDNSTNLVVEMTWTAKDGNNATQTNGPAFVDLDLYVDDTLLVSGSRSPEYGSYNGSGSESFTMPTGATSKKYYVGVMYYGNEVTPTSGYTTEYTIKVYPSGNVAAAQTYTGSLSGVTTNSDKVYFEMYLNKTSSGFAFEELSNKFSLTGY